MTDKPYFLFISIFTSIVIVGVTSCVSTKTSNENSFPTKEKQPDEKIGENHYIITAPLVKKKFVKKNGEETSIEEWYVRRSVQDYFIKLCEGNVTRQKLEEELSKNSTQSLTMEVEFKEGSWDICDDNQIQQSRIGRYIVIHKIVDAKNQD